jgi:mono/diheme cytochrome c family protein
VAVDGVLPAPPHDASGHTWHHPDDLLAQIVREGGVVYMADSNMPGYGEQLTDDDIAAVLAHIKTWWTDEQRAFQAEQSASQYPRR